MKLLTFLVVNINLSCVNLEVRCIMPRGRPRKNTAITDESKAVRLTFRLDEDTAALFKTIAAIRRITLEELGAEAIQDMIEKNISLLKKLQVP